MRIISVEPLTPMLSLTWMIGSRCNYDCMYCPDELHDKTSVHPSLEKLKLSWHNFYAKTKHHKLPYKISFTGGEVTANRSFLPLIDYLRKEDFDIQQIVVTTNGSASLKYYQRLCKLIDSLSFSTHSEYINEKEFFEKVLVLDQQLVRPKKSFHVNVMDESWNQDRIKLYKQWLESHGVSYSINKIDTGVGVRSYPILKGVYNIEQV